MMYQKILVPLDSSELAECVLPHVESIAKGCRVREVIFIHVLEPISISGAGAAYGVFTEEQLNKIDVDYNIAVQSYLDSLVGGIRYDNVSVQTTIIRGKVAESIAEYATNNKIDLIIMSTHGRSGISRLALGSVADRILRLSCVPILMIRVPGCVPGI